jgi:hypothetical protein
MGSLLPGWDRKKRGTIPKAMRDFEEPTKIPNSPRSPRATVTAKPVATPSSPPKLGRTSCPPSLHGSAHFPSRRYSEDTPVPMSQSSKPINSLNPLTVVLPGSPRSPRSPPKTSPFANSAPAGGLFAKLLEKGDADDDGCAWSSRVESSALNQRPDPCPDLEEWRHGSFKPEDTLHTMHILNCEPGSPKKHQTGEGC